MEIRDSNFAKQICGSFLNTDIYFIVHVYHPKKQL